MDNRLKFIKEITDLHGVSGFEGQIKDYIRKKMEGLAEISYDNLGSIICKKSGTSDQPKIMIPGHMDEIGFMVNSITKEGFIKFIPLGGWWDQVLLAQRVIIKTEKGDIPGVIGSTPPHVMSAKDKEKVTEKKNMFIDIGATSKEEAIKEFGVIPGCPIVPDSPFSVMKNENFILAKAFDDRLGCALFMEVIETLNKENHPNTVFGVGTVQEEVGLRGATTAANSIQPDICFTLDVAIATDTPGMEKDLPEVNLGMGPVLLLMDASMIGHEGLRNFVISVAKEENIPLQLTTMTGGGTDAGAVHKSGSGVPSVVLGIPTRYIHSHTGLIHRNDYEECLKLLLALVRKLDMRTVNNIKNQ